MDGVEERGCGLPGVPRRGKRQRHDNPLHGLREDIPAIIYIVKRAGC
jgi:hypothetical protein